MHDPGFVLGAGLSLGRPRRLHAAEEGRHAGRLGGRDVEIGDLHDGGGHGLYERFLDQDAFKSDRPVAALLPRDETRSRHLFPSLPRSDMLETDVQTW